MVFVINSAPGVGKTTALGLLQSKLPPGFAILDGDDVGRTVPLENTTEWLNMIQDNIVSCCINFRRYGRDHMAVCFVLPSSERIGRLKGILEREGFEVGHITLFCDETEVKRRITERNTSRLINVERAIELNGMVKALNPDCRIDTTSKTAESVCKEIYRYISGRISQESGGEHAETY